MGVLNKPQDELRLIDSAPWFAAPNQRDCGAVLTVIKTPEHLPDDVATLKAALIETRAKLSRTEALIPHLQLVIEKMEHETFGPRSERSQRLLDEMELQVEELAAAASEDLARIADHPNQELPELLPWRWKLTHPPPAAKAA